MLPRLGVLHFTLAMVFVPFGAPQAETVTAVRSRIHSAARDARGASTPATALARLASYGRGSGTTTH